ncbi:MAG: yloA [Haloplasmataceae bacterium]|jgi:predicted ribosome quality control (RQC) complex YloA/Tae2 family protein|nr:yloA [Haloplasmataceae bacterium]
MAFDGVFTHYTTLELKNNLLNGRVNKIYQISDYELVFVIRANNKTQKLLFSINPNYARIHITENEFNYPQEPPMFCMLLRKHMEGGIITDIYQKDNDRIVFIEFEHLNEIGDKDIKQLIIEIMGKHSNIVLLNKNTGIILDCIKHISPFQNSVRTLQPGATYIYPPSNEKKNFFLASLDDFKTFNYTDPNLSKQIVNYFEGVSPLLANELIYNTSIYLPETLYTSYLSFINKLNNEINPTIMYTKNKTNFYLTPLNSIENVEEIKTFESIGSMLDRFYLNKDEHERIKQQTQDLEKYIKNEIDKNYTKVEHLKTDLLVANNYDFYKLFGELIVANSYLINKGIHSIDVINYYNNENITIELDPFLTPIENSQRYYQKYQKAKKAIVHINEQILKTKDEIYYFETLFEQLKNANIVDALEIRQELEEGGYLKRNITKKRKNKKPQFETYMIDGIEILVGKNNLQNEYLTHKLADKNDMWMHAKGMPGSHVIVRTSDVLTENLIRTAAMLAAYYSKGRLSSSVPIDYTRIKNVKKIPGGKPGFVTFDNQKTIYIDPDEDFILALNKKK